MNLYEFDNNDDRESVVEAQMVWARSGKKLVRKYRCTVGMRAGRIVSDQ